MEKHPALNLPPEAVKSQRIAVASLKANPLERWVEETGVLAAGVQLRLAAHPSPRVTKALSYNTSLLRRTQLALYERSSALWVHLACNPALHEEVAELLIDNGGAVLLLYGAPEGALSEETLMKIAQRSNSALNACLADRPDLTTPVVTELLTQELDGYTRSKLLSNPCIPSEVCEEVKENGSSQDLAALILNPATPRAEAVKLLLKGGRAVYAAGVRREDITGALLDKLIYEGDSSTHVEASRRKCLTSEHITFLFENALEDLDLTFLKRPDIPFNLLERARGGEFGASIQSAIAVNPRLSLTMIQEIIKECEPVSLAYLARNETLPQSAQDELAAVFGKQLSTHSLRSAACGRFLSNPCLNPQPYWPLQLLLKLPESKTRELFSAARINAEFWKVVAPSWEGSLSDLEAAGRHL